jgi:PAS domain S-box-containing protein
MSDITMRKRAESQREAALQDLQESKGLIDAVVENVPLMIFLKEAKDLRFVIFNRAGEELLGYDRKSLLGKNNLDLFPAEQAAFFMAKDREVLDGGADILDIQEEPIMTAKKGQRLLHTRKFCIRGADGTTKYLLGISEDITERKEAEAKLLAYQEQLRALTSELTLIEEKERRRIASELHDQIGQNLALCKLKVAALEKNLGDDAMKSELAMVRRLLECSIQDARSLIFDLSPPVLYELGFAAALEWLAERIQEQFRIPVEFESRLRDPELKNDQQVILFQVVRELLVNMGKHSQARQAKVILSQEKPFLKIQVNDDGVGFDASRIFAPKEQNSGFGFFSMRERLNYLGGSLEVKSKPGQGSQIILTVPQPGGVAVPKKEN